MTRPVPVAFRWIDVDVMDANGVVETRPAMVPLHRFRKVCDRQYGDPGGVFILSPDEHGSDRSRRHFFACLRTAWQNLPEAIAHRYPTPELLRKTALIKAGYRNERHHVCGTYEEALKLGALFKEIDEFCVTVIRDNVLSIYTARSMATFAMKKDEWQAAKNAVLDLVAGLIGSTREELTKHSPEGEEDDHRRNPDHSLEQEAPGKPVEGPGRRPALLQPRDGGATGGGAAAAAGAKTGDQA